MQKKITITVSPELEQELRAESARRLKPGSGFTKQESGYTAIVVEAIKMLLAEAAKGKK
jgi:hypothetical protein